MRWLLVATVLALMLAPSALAQGASPSQAFPLTVDRQFTGATSNQAPDGNGRYSEFSSIALLAGDYITVDWSEPIGADNRLYLMPPQINDNNWYQTDALVERDPSPTGGDEFTTSIVRSGTYYFRLTSYDDGASYSITVHIRRGVKPGDVPSSARVATSARTNHGDVSTHVPDTDGYYREFWKVKLRSGDHVNLSWSQPSGGSDSLYVLPVGTTNGNFLNEDTLADRGSSSSGHDAFGIVAPRTGWYYLEFKSGSPGAYSFSYSIKHRK